MKRNWGKIRRFIPMYLMLLPGLVYLFINNYMPMAGIIIAFKKYNYSLGIFKSPFTGLKNFEFLFKTKDAWTITRNTLGYNVIFIVVGTVLAIAVAILLNEIRSTMGKKIYQTLILVPFLISIVVVSYLVYGFLSTDAGFINNSILKPMGKQGIGWYSDPKYWPFILIFVNVWKNLGYNIIFIVLGTVLAIAVAILLNEIRSTMGKKVYQTLILVPFLISIVVVSYLVYGFLSTDAGFINNSILKPMGKEAIGWYSNAKYWPFILIFVNIWKNLGYNCIIYYATVVGLDASLYESASIDGANRWQRIVHITLPGLKTTIITLTLMSVGRIFYSDFGLFYQVPMNSGPLIDVTNTIDTYVYRGLMELNNIGMASAAGLYQSLVGFALVLIANLIVRRLDENSALF